MEILIQTIPELKEHIKDKIVCVWTGQIAIKADKKALIVSIKQLQQQFGEFKIYTNHDKHFTILFINQKPPELSLMAY